jgi:HSF-type DNA-binding
LFWGSRGDAAHNVELVEVDVCHLIQCPRFFSLTGCYQIPKKTIELKIDAAKAAAKVQLIKERKEKLGRLGMSLEEEILEPHELQPTGNSKEDESNVTPIGELSIPCGFDVNDVSLQKHREEYEHPNMSKLLAYLISEHPKDGEAKLREASTEISEDDSTSIDEEEEMELQIFNQFAEFVSNRPELSDEGGEVKVIVLEESLPPFKSKLGKRYLPFDLAGGDNFPHELYRLLEEAEHWLISHIISWQKGKSFKVYDEKAFEEKVLSDCCAKSNAFFDCFRANLASFGFSVVENGKRQGGFEHESFRRGNRQRVSQIRRILGFVSDVGRGTGLEGRYHLGSSRLFPYHLHGLLSDAERLGLTSIISWQTGGRSFRIHDRDLFESKVLGRCFGGQFKAFRRSLTRFGFDRIVKDTYEHPYFLRGEPLKLQWIEPDSAHRTWNVHYDLADKESFLLDLLQLLEDAGPNCWERVISWNADGKSFSVHDREIFEMMVLQHHSNLNFQRFTMFLKGFGFVEMAKGVKSVGYRHVSFFRGCSDEHDLNAIVWESQTKTTLKNSKRRGLLQHEPPEDVHEPRSIATTQSSKSGSTSNCRRSESKLTPPCDLSESPQFPRNLHALLEKADSEEWTYFVLHWLPDGNSFVITDEDAFIEQFLQQGSKGSSFDDFERTLLSFGFEKMKTRGNHHRYGHPHFVRNVSHKQGLLGLQIAQRKTNGESCNNNQNVNRSGCIPKKLDVPTSNVTSSRKRKGIDHGSQSYDSSHKTERRLSSRIHFTRVVLDSGSVGNVSWQYSGETIKSKQNGPTKFAESMTSTHDDRISKSIDRKFRCSDRCPKKSTSKLNRRIDGDVGKLQGDSIAPTEEVGKAPVAFTEKNKYSQTEENSFLSLDELYKVATTVPSSLDEVYKVATTAPSSLDEIYKVATTDPTSLDLLYKVATACPSLLDGGGS